MQNIIKKSSRFIKRSSKKAGMSPGTLVHVGEQRLDEARISVMNYDQDRLEEKELKRIEESFAYKDTPPVSWINIDGLHDVELIEKVGTHFGIHVLTLEDIVNTGQRPKIEDYEDYIYLVIKMLKFDEAASHIVSEQVSLILGPH